MNKRLSHLFSRSLDWIEKVGNRLPHPATLFALFALSVVFVSALGDWLALEAVHPISKDTISVKSLLSPEGIRWMYSNLVANFVDFPPLGLVLVVMVGIGLAEGSGMFNTLIRTLVMNAPARLITASIVFAGIIAHLASSVGYVILIPLGAMIFHAVGRHPMAGLAAAFCGVSGGFGANFLIGSVDPILAGLSTSAAQIIDPDMTINPAVNFYFMFVSAVFIVIVGTFVTEKIVEPRLARDRVDAPKLECEAITPLEKKGLRWAGISLLILVAILLALVIPKGAVLRQPETGSVLHGPFLTGIITGIMLFFFIPGCVYGIVVGTIKNDKQAVKHIVKSMNGLSGYIVLVFFAAQFVYFFKYSNLGVILAIKGAEGLKSIGFTGITLIVCFVFLSALINMFMGSASAKWAIMAPVFIPMFMLLGYHPSLTQAAFRIGDSVTNLITPMMSYFALIVTYAQKYDEKHGIGTIISTMIPYTLVLTLVWIIILIIWMFLGIPLGPDGPIMLAG